MRFEMHHSACLRLSFRLLLLALEDRISGKTATGEDLKKISMALRSEDTSAAVLQLRRLGWPAAVEEDC